jgi:G3E family GTPase
MTKNEIIEMAKQAWLSDKEAQFITEFDEGYISCTYLKDLTAFAKLVAEHERNEIIEILDASTGYVHMDAIRERT